MTISKNKIKKIMLLTGKNHAKFTFYNNGNNNSNNNNDDEAITCISIKMGTWIRLFVTQLITQKSNKNQK